MSIPTDLRRAARLAPPLVALASSSLLFWLAGLGSSYLEVDSGPLPVDRPQAGDAIGAGKIVLWLSLFLTQLGALYLLADRTGSPAFAAAASTLLIWNGWTGRYAGVLMTELPFLACLTLATLGACRMLAGGASRPMRLGVLPLASAVLCQTRYLGVFFPVVFSLVFLQQAARERRPRRCCPVARPAELLAHCQPPPFPTRTETYAVALQLLPPEAPEFVLCNFCQALAVDRPEARIVAIPSREDFVYEMDLAELARRHGIGWIVLFDLPARERLYPPWFVRWLEEPPTEVEIAGGHRLRDGVIYRLATPHMAP